MIRHKPQPSAFDSYLIANHLNKPSDNGNLPLIVMERREAVQVFREICECIPDLSVLSGVLLRPQNHSGESLKDLFDLQVNAILDAMTMKLVRAVVRKRGLVLKANRQYLLVHSIHLKNLGENTWNLNKQTLQQVCTLEKIVGTLQCNATGLWAVASSFVWCSDSYFVTLCTGLNGLFLPSFAMISDSCFFS